MARSDFRSEGSERFVVQALLPAPLSAALMQACEVTGQSQSALVREVLTAELMRRGFWPPLAGGSTNAG